MIQTKKCIKCGATKELNDKNFVQKGGGRYRTECRLCKNAYNRARHFAKYGNRRIARAELREADPKICSRCGNEKPLDEFNWQDKKKTCHKSYCKVCQSDHAKNYYAGEGKDVQGAYKEKNKEKYDELSVKFRKEYKKNGKREKYNRKHILKQYNLTQEDYERLLEGQNGQCAICGKKKPGGNRKHFSVDHCHKTGKVRGLLCYSCNISLGLMGDNPETVQSAYDYLTKHLTQPKVTKSK